MQRETPGTAPNEAVLNEWIGAIAERRDRAALAALFDHYGPRIKAYLMHRGSDEATAEEVVQEVMVTLWRRAETFDPTRASATTWVFTVARNKRVDLIRREKRPALDPDDPTLQDQPERSADLSLELRQDAERLRNALQTLPEEQRSLLHRAFFEDKAHSAIAAETGLPLGTVKSRIRLAMARLRTQLQDA
ncbi:MAG: sigma-70 family RNA polymerase sigma factor [Rhodospirillaceae bacterium]|nr:sigma-70 family RNA polymerase sigma factor [Rhodospirillaceae bacterium]